jgi:hypothetical protein
MLSTHKRPERAGDTVSQSSPVFDDEDGEEEDFTRPGAISAMRQRLGHDDYDGERGDTRRSPGGTSAMMQRLGLRPQVFDRAEFEVVTLLLRCCSTVVTLPLHCFHTVVILLSTVVILYVVAFNMFWNWI